MSCPPLQSHRAARHRVPGAPTVMVVTLAAAVVPVLAVSPASAADGASVARVQGNVTYNSGVGAVNNVQVSIDASGQIEVADAAGVSAVAPCANVTAQLVRCGTGVTQLNVILADGPDQVSQQAPVLALVQGNGENNTLRVGRAPGAAATRFLGGEGFDTVDYSQADRFVTVTLDDLDNDGRPGDRDNISATVEQVIGSGFPDQLTGGALSNVLDGALGSDVMTALAGNDRFAEGSRANGADVLLGGAGIDTADYSGRTADLRIALNGVADDGQVGELDKIREVETVVSGSGSDVLVGGLIGEELRASSGDDELSGGNGDDTLVGGQGTDVHRGGAGNDTIVARDGERDIVQCGVGSQDHAEIDSRLDEVRGCESVGTGL